MKNHIAPDLFFKLYSAEMAPIGQASSQAPQSMQVFGLTSKCASPSAIAETGQASAQEPQEMQASEILCAMSVPPKNNDHTVCT